jgi:hypothetical protein
MQVRFLPGVPRTRPDGDGSSFQNCDSGFDSSRVCHVRDAEAVEAAVCKTVLTGFESRLSLHRRARSNGNAFWSRKPALRQRPGWGFDSSALRHDFLTSLKYLLFPDRFTYYVIAVMLQAIQFGRMPQGRKPACVDTLNPREGP